MTDDLDKPTQWDHRSGVWHDLEGAALEALEALGRVTTWLEKCRCEDHLGLPYAEWDKRHGALLEALDAINDRRVDEGEFLGSPDEADYYGEAPKERP